MEQMKQATQDFIDKVGQPVAGHFTTPPHPIVIEIVGTGFFDRLHGQSGMAPNGLEIHPVLSLRVVQ
jgi:hypothetical protein